MTDPRPNNEPRPRVEPQESSPAIPGTVVAVVALVLGIAWLVIFVVGLTGDGGTNWFDTWWPLVTGIAFVALGVERLRRSLRR